MKRHHRRLVWRLCIAYILVVLLTTAAVGINASSWVMPHYVRSMQRELLDKSRMIAPQLTELLRDHPEQLQEAVVSLGQAGSSGMTTRITIIDPDGDVLADSVQLPELMGKHDKRREFIAVMGGADIGRDRRISPTLNIEMMYAAVPLKVDGRTVAVLRSAMPVSDIQEAAAVAYRRITIGAVIVAAMASILGILLSLGISRPIEQIARDAQRFASGQLAGHVSAEGYAEVESLADSLNSMAAQLNERIRSLLRQQKEQQAVLTGMAEGVVAIDMDQRVLILNQSAAEMLAVHVAQPQGRTLAEAVRHRGFQEFVRRGMTAPAALESEISFTDGGSHRTIRVHGSPLRDDEERRKGLVIVLSDITRLRRLENVRRDFVANVSHELKTPVTSIQGFIETLRDEQTSTEDRARFLQIIAHQAERLSAIIDDLLSLSRIEQDAEHGRLDLSRVLVGNVLSSAVEGCQAAARERGISLRVEAPAALRMRANAQLLEQAVANLLQNAVRYSRDGDMVIVRAEADESMVHISVIDHGCGIPAEHLPRIFERFYCVDKARSRKAGGTGLGLAIVKHIAQAHGGRVTVSSRVDEGSTFTLHLPIGAV